MFLCYQKKDEKSFSACYQLLSIFFEWNFISFPAQKISKYFENVPISSWKSKFYHYYLENSFTEISFFRMPSTQNILAVSLIALALITTVLVFHDNTDHSARTLRTPQAELHMVSTEHADMLHTIEKEYHEKVIKEREITMQKAAAKENACLKNASATSNPKEQLQSFVEGDCAPVIFVPGLMSSKLMAEIDCETLQEKHPEVMRACGWSTCTWSLFKWRPASEYMMWIPDLLSPLAFLTLTNNTCFGNIIKVDLNASETDIYQRYKSPEGIRITWYGNTEKTKKVDDGGFRAIENLLPLPFQSSSTVAFHGLDTYFTGLGYQKGLTMFAIPYDYRLTHLANSVSYTLERTINYAYELTGKKVIIVCHSLGNLNTLSVLNRMKQEDKDRMVAAYVAVTPPYGGASKTLRLALGGDNSFLFLNKLYGMNFYNQKLMIGTGSSAQDLMPKDTFFKFRNEPWMKELLKRVELEKKYKPDTPEGADFWKKVDPQEVPFAFFPTPADECFSHFSTRPTQCMTGITDLASEPIVSVNNETYFANTSSMHELLKKHFTMNDIEAVEQMQNDSLASGVHLFTNPNVPIVYLYGSHLPTELHHQWDYNPEELSGQGQYAFPTNTTNKYGDGTVEVSYSLPTALKWAYEHTHNQPNAKPIKIVEYCSHFNQKSNVWDAEDNTGATMMNSTEYMGSECGCTLDPKLTCDHAGLLIDNHLVELIGNTAVTKQKAADPSSTGAFRIPQEHLLNLIDELPHLRRDRNDTDVMKWLYPNSTSLENENLVLRVSASFLPMSE